MPRDAEVEGVYDDIVNAPDRWVEVAAAAAVRAPGAAPALRRRAAARRPRPPAPAPVRRAGVGADPAGQSRRPSDGRWRGSRRCCARSGRRRWELPDRQTCSTAGWRSGRRRWLPLARAWLSALGVEPARARGNRAESGSAERILDIVRGMAVGLQAVRVDRAGRRDWALCRPTRGRRPQRPAARARGERGLRQPQDLHRADAGGPGGDPRRQAGAGGDRLHRLQGGRTAGEPPGDILSALGPGFRAVDATWWAEIEVTSGRLPAVLPQHPRAVRRRRGGGISADGRDRAGGGDGAGHHHRDRGTGHLAAGRTDQRPRARARSLPHPGPDASSTLASDLSARRVALIRARPRLFVGR